jgi:hypothetical protein
MRYSLEEKASRVIIRTPDFCVPMRLLSRTSCLLLTWTTTYAGLFMTTTATNSHKKMSTHNSVRVIGPHQRSHVIAAGIRFGHLRWAAKTSTRFVGWRHLIMFVGNDDVHFCVWYYHVFGHVTFWTLRAVFYTVDIIFGHNQSTSFDHWPQSFALFIYRYPHIANTYLTGIQRKVHKKTVAISRVRLRDPKWK